MKYNVALVTTLFPSKEKPYSGTFISEHARWLISQDWVKNVYLIHPSSKIRYLSTLIQLIKLKAIDIIDAQFALPAGLFGIFKPSIPMILMTHRWEVVDFDNFFYNLLLKIAFFRADQIIYAGSHIGKRIRDIYPKSIEKSSNLYNGVDVQLIQSFRKKTEKVKRILQNTKSNDSLKIVTVAQLIKRKGIDIVISGLAQLDPSVNYDYFIIGAGSELLNLKTQINNLNLSKSVHLVGPLVGKDLFSFINSTDIFILMASSEGYSFAVLEGKVAGNVVILANYKGSKEAITPEIEGYIIDRNPFSVKRIITKLWGEKENLERIKAYNQENASKHDLSHKFNSLKEIYDRGFKCKKS